MELEAIARDGIFSTAGARVLGLGTRQLQGLARAGACTALTRGWWAIGVPDDSLGRHRLMATALRRHFAGRAWVSHYSALALKHLPVDDADLGRVHLTRTTDRQSRRQPTFTVHPAVRTDTGEASRLSTAIVQSGTVTTAVAALCAADAALARGLVTHESIREALMTRTVLNSLRPAHGASRARCTVVGRVDVRSHARHGGAPGRGCEGVRVVDLTSHASGRGARLTA